MGIRIREKFFSFQDVEAGSRPGAMICLVPEEEGGAGIEVSAHAPWILLQQDKGPYPGGKIPFSIDTSQLRPGTSGTGSIDLTRGASRECAYISVSVARNADYPVTRDTSMRGKIITVFTEKGRLTLVHTGKHGGEGDIYLVQEDRSLCAKIFHQNRDRAVLQKKIQVMISSPPADHNSFSSLAWPQALLYADQEQKDFIGFLMPYIDRNDFSESHVLFDPGEQHRFFSDRGTFRNLLAVALNLSGIVSAVHQKGHCIGDLRDTNILVAKNARVAIIDCDSFQIKDWETGSVYPTTVGSPEYLPPELTSGATGLTCGDRRGADLFALSIIIFRLLMDGVHPYQARGPGVRAAPTTRAKIILGLFPYHAGNKAVKPPECAPPYRRIPPSLQRLFYRCFVTGNRRPGARPSSAEWKAVLSREFSQLLRCQSDPDHWYSPDLIECPFCDTERYSPGSPVPTMKRATPTVPAAVHQGPGQSTAGPMISGEGSPQSCSVQLPGKERSPVNQVPALQGSDARKTTIGPGMPVAAGIQIISPDGHHRVKSGDHQTGNQDGRSMQPEPPEPYAENASAPQKNHLNGPAGHKDVPASDMVAQLSQGSFQEQMEAREALARRGPAVVPCLLDAARSGKTTYRAIRPVIREIGPAAVPLLVSGHDPVYSVHGAFILQAIRDFGPEAVRPLLHTIGEKGTEFQLHSLFIVRDAGPAAIEVIASELPSLSARSRIFAFVLLAAVGEVAIPHLVRILRSGDWTLEVMAGWALGVLGTPSILPVILAWQEDPLELSRRVFPVMEHIGPAAVPPVISLYRSAGKTLQTGLNILVHQLCQIYPAAFVPFIGDPDYLVRDVVVRALCAAGEPALPMVTGYLSTDDLLMRAGVAEVISSGGPSSIPLLSEAFLHGNNRTRTSAARILVRMGGASIPALASIARGSKGQVRTDALSALVTIGAPGAPSLVQIVLDEPGTTPGTREAVKALTDVYRENPVSVSDLLCSYSQDMRLELLNTIRSAGRAGEPLLAVFLADTDAAIRDAALTGSLEGGVEAIRMLLIQAGTSSTGQEVFATFMRSNGTPRVYACLTRLILDPEDLVAEGAIGILLDSAQYNPSFPQLFSGILPDLDEEPVVRLLTEFDRIPTPDREVLLQECIWQRPGVIRDTARAFLGKEILFDQGMAIPSGSGPGAISRRDLFREDRSMDRPAGNTFPAGHHSPPKPNVDADGAMRRLKELLLGYFNKKGR